jgi:F0F1-type ATP synthase assembly protein I
MPDNKRDTANALYELATVGFVFPIAIGLGYLLGHWLDRLLGTGPWLTVILTAFGIIAAFVNLFRAGTKSDGRTETTVGDGAGSGEGSAGAGAADRDPDRRP